MVALEYEEIILIKFDVNWDPLIPDGWKGDFNVEWNVFPAYYWSKFTIFYDEE